MHTVSSETIILQPSIGILTMIGCFGFHVASHSLVISQLSYDDFLKKVLEVPKIF